MKTKSFFYYAFVILLAGMLSGCIKQRVRSLPKISIEEITQGSNEPLVCAAHVFNTRDCKNYLGKNVLDNGYQPIRLVIANRSQTAYRFSLDSSGLDYVPVAQVVEDCNLHISTTALGYGVVGALGAAAASAVLTGIICVGSFGSMGVGFIPFFAAQLFPLIALPVVAISTLIGIAQAKSSNHQSREEFTFKALADELIIHPAEAADGIIFIPEGKLKNFNFKLRLINTATQMPEYITLKYL